MCIISGLCVKLSEGESLNVFHLLSAAVHTFYHLDVLLLQLVRHDDSVFIFLFFSEGSCCFLTVLKDTKIIWRVHTAGRNVWWEHFPHSKWWIMVVIPTFNIQVKRNYSIFNLFSLSSCVISHNKYTVSVKSLDTLYWHCQLMSNGSWLQRVFKLKPESCWCPFHTNSYGNSSIYKHCSYQM